MLPTFSFEQSAWGKGYSMVIGVDEVGRGALAGPVVAGAAMVRAVGLWSLVVSKENKKKIVVMPRTKDQRLTTILSLGIDDSKRLTPKQRQALVPQIEQYFHCAIGEASVAEINTHGIVEATRKAMRRAIKWITNNQQPTTNNSLNLLLLDAFPLPHCPGFPLSRQQAIIRGDQQSISIAAASIIAKVYRDGLMTILANKYPLYCWQQNKGYGTNIHRHALRQWGCTSQHRLQFVQKK